MTIEELSAKIRNKLPESEVYARDLTGDGNHFEAVIVHASFEGRSRLERQRAVMSALSEDLKGPLHALTLKTYTQKEWENL
jgi:acid stress-induced BolA-like protein IbaG/YrbA